MHTVSAIQPLPAHLEARYGIDVAEISELDLGVFRVDRHDGPPWVARVFPAARPPGRAAGDAEILGLLADYDYPAERCAAAEPVSVLEGQPVLVTEHVAGVPRPERREAIRALGGLRRLGEMLGRLHTLPEPDEGVRPPARDAARYRAGGGWHHLADGSPQDEIAAIAALLSGSAGPVPAAERDLQESLRVEAEGLDGGAGLPQALAHPDFVLANVIASPDRGLVVVDWTGAGRAARLWSLAFLLFSAGARDLRRVDRVVAGYRVHVRPEPEELARLTAVLRVRPMALEMWSLRAGRQGLAQAAQAVAGLRELTDAIGARARLAFQAPD